MRIIGLLLAFSGRAFSVAVFLLSATYVTGGEEIVLSSPTNGVYVGITTLSPSIAFKVAAYTNSTPFNCEDSLKLLLFSAQGSCHIAYPQKNAHFMRFEMINAKGKKVPKTVIGKAWGSSFGKVSKRMGREFSIAEYAVPLFVERSHKNLESIACGPSLPSPLELFDLKEDGLYFLNIEVFVLKAVLSPEGKITKWESTTLCLGPVRVQK
jgi:hypothetical protein